MNLGAEARLEAGGFVRGCCHCPDELYDILEKEAEWTDLVTTWMGGERVGEEQCSGFEE